MGIVLAVVLTLLGGGFSGFLSSTTDDNIQMVSHCIERCAKQNQDSLCTSLRGVETAIASSLSMMHDSTFARIRRLNTFIDQHDREVCFLIPNGHQISNSRTMSLEGEIFSVKRGICRIIDSLYSASSSPVIESKPPGVGGDTTIVTLLR